MWCIVGDGVRGRFTLSSGGWGRGKWSRLRASLSSSSGWSKIAGQFVKFEWLKSISGDWEGREALNTPRITDSTDALHGYVPRLARRPDFGRIFEDVGSSSAESVHARDWSKQHQGRQGAYMAMPADQMHTDTGLGARSSNQQRVSFFLSWGRKIGLIFWQNKKLWREMKGVDLSPRRGPLPEWEGNGNQGNATVPISVPGTITGN